MGSMIDLAAQSRETGGSERLVGYVARPDGPGPFPGVVMIHEVFGLEEDTRRQADRLARAGYLVVAPDLYTAGPALRCVVATMRAMQRGTGTAFADLDAARRWLVAQSDCTGRVGAIGFCMGGGFALLLAGRGDYDASSVNYGRLPEDPHEVLAQPCPIVASYGAKDPSLRGAAAKLDRWLDGTGVAHDVKEYPNAGHSFLRDPDAGPDWLRVASRIGGVGPEPDSAADAWRRIEAFFAEHLG